jgi:hypothetical protein
MEAGAFKATFAHVQPAQIGQSKVTSGKIDSLCVDLPQILAAEIKIFKFAALAFAAAVKFFDRFFQDKLVAFVAGRPAWGLYAHIPSFFCPI